MTVEHQWVPKLFFLDSVPGLTAYIKRVSSYMWVSVCVCVCRCETQRKGVKQIEKGDRERERERERGREGERGGEVKDQARLLWGLTAS